MNKESLDKTYIITGAGILFLAVLIGAFGAHGLKESLTDKYLATYQTGVTYHYYHGLGILILGLIKKNYPELNLKLVYMMMLTGIGLFSFNCYIYAITQIKLFALIVPVGGLSFIGAWALLANTFVRSNK